MCTVMAALGTALSVASSVGGFVQQQAATDAYNAQAAQAHQDASLAAQYKYEDEQRRMTYDAKANQQEGYKAALAGRSAASTVIASAGSAGFDAGSISVSAILAGERQKAAENEARVQTKLEDLKDSFEGRVKSHEAEAQGRINSMPFKAGPNPLGLAINIAGAAFKGYQAATP